MKGSHQIIIKNNRLNYKFTIYRDITILRGDSATGKTTLIEMVDAFCRDGVSSGIEVICDKKCVVLTRGNWERDLKDYRDCIVFIDEGNAFVRSKNFAEMVKRSDNYYVIATRESLFELPYSIHEIYGVRNKSGNRYQGTKRLYSELYPIYNADDFQGKPDKVIIEDSNSAYQFFSAICKKENILCESAKGKTKIYDKVREATEDKILVIADGAAFGPEMERAISLKRAKNVVYFLPESFEWLILKSGLVAKNEIKQILDKPYDFIESEQYLSWEQFFTKLLVDKAKDSPLAYKKRTLNPAYLHSKNKNAIMNTTEEVAGSKILGK